MKRKTFLLIAVCMTSIVHATVLRVNNADASAPYATIKAAVTAAAEGDTIMVEGTPVDYDGVTVDKRVVLIGAGYWLRENGISTEAAQPASIQEITTTEEGTVLMGLLVYGNINIEGAKTVVTRCLVKGSIGIKGGTDYCVVRQNFLSGDVGSGYDKSSYHQITNNIFGNISCKGINSSYIAYNTSFHHWGESFWNSANCKVEKNIFYTHDINAGDGNTIQDNYVIGELFQDIQTDKDVRDSAIPQDATAYGAFAGDDPYVISGIPAGPIIEELTIPTSVEEGGTMEVALKLGSVK